jgi:hypothetical protein
MLKSKVVLHLFRSLGFATRAMLSSMPVWLAGPGGDRVDMADSYTPNLNLQKPEVGAATNSWGGTTNDDWDKVDAVFAPDGSGTGVGLKIAAATTTAAAMMLVMAGIMTGTGSVNLLGMSAVDATDTTFGIRSATDATRIVRISTAAVNTGSTRTISMIDADVTIVGATNTQTLTNKTLSSPAINTATLSVATTGIQFLGTTTGTMSLLAAATATGSVVMPSGLTLDTMAVLTAAQTFLNKTISGAVNTITNVSLTTGVTGILPAANGGFPGVTTTTSLGGDVSISSSATYFDGPAIAQGTTGTWLVMGTATLQAATQGTTWALKLWDGGSKILSSTDAIYEGPAGGGQKSISLSGIVTSPAGNVRISASSNVTTSKFAFNVSGNSLDCTLTAVRLA